MLVTSLVWAGGALDWIEKPKQRHQQCKAAADVLLISLKLGVLDGT